MITFLRRRILLLLFVPLVMIFANVVITYPNTHVSWRAGNTYTITWTNAWTSSYWLILTTHGSFPQTYTISTNVWGPSGSYNWSIPSNWNKDESIEWYVKIFVPYSGEQDESNSHIHVLMDSTRADPP
jgi:hypothetical protein